MRREGSRDSSVGMSTAGCITDESRFVSWQEQEFCLFSTSQRPAVGPTQPAIRLVLGTRRGLQAGRTPASSAGVKYA